MSYHLLFKLLIIGESGVGKTCLLLRYAENQFEENFLSTIGVDFKVKEIEVDGLKVKLQIWDSAGQERFKNITASYYRSCSGIIIVYDVTRNETYEAIPAWIDEVRKYVPSVPLLLIGNKCDLDDQREVPKEKGVQLAQKYDLSFFETSAKDSIEVEAPFLQMTRCLIQESKNKKEKKENPDDKLINIREQRPTKKQKDCC